MQILQTNNQNIILNQIKFIDDNSFTFNEVIPFFKDSIPDYSLSLDFSLNLYWSKYIPPLEFEKGNGIILTKKSNKLIIDVSLNLDTSILIDNKIKNTEIYYKDGKVGISTLPRFTYKFDIAVPSNKLTTAFHVGDGSYGFSMGNGTDSGFLPQILGIGSDENDAGLYLLGKSSNNLDSEVPLIIIDGRNSYNGKLEHRPILGITSGDYSNYKFIIDQFGRIGIGKIPEIYKLEVNGSISAENIYINQYNFKDIINTIQVLENKISELNLRLSKFE
jgi:hypothetical protein